MQARVCALLQENMAVITSIRENMVMGRFLDNHSLMLTFDKNVKEVTALLATLPFAEMQKLPVQVIILVCASGQVHSSVLVWFWEWEV